MMRATVAAENAVIEGFDGVTFGIHLCRGNEQSHWHREGHYDAIAEELFGTLRHERLLLEYDTERAGGFEPLRFVRPGAIAVLGLITTKSGELEDRDDLLRRIEEASRFLPVEQLAHQPAVRLRLRRGGQRPHAGRAVGQARPHAGGLPGRVGLGACQ